MSSGGDSSKFTLLRAVNEYSKALLDSVRNAASQGSDPQKALENTKEAWKNKLAADLVDAYSGSTLRTKLGRAASHLDKVKSWACQAWPRSGGVIMVEARLVEGSKLLVGGSSGVLQAVFEVGLAWDYVFDLPYIPGSSLKGAMRSAALALLGSSYGDLIDSIFGSRNASGCLEVFDAYPIEVSDHLLEPDVITPHYYSGGVIIDSELEAQPVPVVHVSVAPGTVFRFIISHRCSRGILNQLSAALSSELKISASGSGSLAALLSAALLSGVGARTGKGYGVFMPLSYESGCSANTSFHERR